MGRLQEAEMGEKAVEKQALLDGFVGVAVKSEQFAESQLESLTNTPWRTAFK